MNGDGNADVTIGASDGSISVRLGNGNGTFAAATTMSTSNSVVQGLATRDVNGDGVLDVIGVGDSGYSSVGLAQTLSGISPLLQFSLNSRANALQALPQFDNALKNLTVQRGVIGAFQSRISVAGNVLETAATNFAAAASQMTDVDVAQEAANLVRSQILQQSSALVLAQSNLQPRVALDLLK